MAYLCPQRVGSRLSPGAAIGPKQTLYTAQTRALCVGVCAMEHQSTRSGLVDSLHRRPRRRKEAGVTPGLCTWNCCLSSLKNV